MFESLSDRLSGVFEKLRGRGALSEQDVLEALREVRIALLEADVALPVTKDFISKVKDRAIGKEVLRSVTPGQQVIKIVNDALTEMLGGGSADSAGDRRPQGDLIAADAALNLSVAPPAVILMVGLQGSGKTTSTGKIALRLKDKERKKTLMASLDTRRPAAQEQLQVLGAQIDVNTLPIVEGQAPRDIANRALKAARLGGYDVLLLDTAGRLSIDEQLMQEINDIQHIAEPVETLLVVDALTGQDAVETAEKFKSRLDITGVVMTRIDGDGRGGAALSMRAVTGAPIKFIGIGEKLEALDIFDPARMAGRILGMGDIVALVEKAAEEVDAQDAERLQKKLEKGKFDLDDLAAQFKQMRNMGGMGAIMGLMPGMGKMKKMLDAAGGFENREILHQEAIISSMTKKERKNPKLMNASRKRRVAAGAGVRVQDVNQLLKSYLAMAGMIRKMGKKGGMKAMARAMGAMEPGVMGPGVMGSGAMGGSLAGPGGMGPRGVDIGGSDPGFDPRALLGGAQTGQPLPPGLPGLPGRSASDKPSLPGLGKSRKK